MQSEYPSLAIGTDGACSKIILALPLGLMTLIVPYIWALTREDS